jgi:hypothetical protein
VGRVLDPHDSMLGAVYRAEDVDLYSIVRCLDRGEARGIVEGDDYLVRTAFLRGVADALLPAHSELRDDAAGDDTAS